MANDEHIALLKKWGLMSSRPLLKTLRPKVNAWRVKLGMAALSGKDLSGANLRGHATRCCRPNDTDCATDKCSCAKPQAAGPER